MANTTVSGAIAIHGQNPQFLVETVIRNRIYESTFWKEHCFALTAESLIDKAIEVRFIGGVYANQRPTEFICLLLKLLQIQPEKEILVEYLRAEEFKYLRALAALYIRMIFPDLTKRRNKFKWNYGKTAIIRHVIRSDDEPQQSTAEWTIGIHAGEINVLYKEKSSRKKVK